MPSYKIHEELGNIILGFAIPDVDRLIDESKYHDASRYSVPIFANQVKTVFSTYGEKGLYYFILHHALDRLVDRIVEELSFRFDVYEGRCQPEKIVSDLLEVVETVDLDPSSILSTFVHKKEDLKWLLPFGKRRRRKRKRLEERLDNAYSDINRYKWLKPLVTPIILEVFNKISQNKKIVLEYLLVHDDGVWKKLETSLRSKIASSVIKYGKMPDVDEFFKCVKKALKIIMGWTNHSSATYT